MKKTATQTFIEKAVEGGWNFDYISDCTIWFLHQGDYRNAEKNSCLCIDHSYTSSFTGEREGRISHISIEKVLLSPSAWQAVGKTEGWSEESISIQDPAEKYAIGMVIALFEGKTLEEYLTTLFV